MRVAINGFFWGQQATGSGQYVQQLLSAMKQVAPDNEYLLFTPRSRAAGNAVDDLAGRSLQTPFSGWQPDLDKVWFEQVAFPGACHTASAQVAHVPYWGSPLRPVVPTVVTVHDLIPLLLPLYRGSLLVKTYTRLAAAAARRAALIITDSLASREDIVRLLHIPAERIRVIYLAAHPACRPVTDPEVLVALRAKYGLPERYILYLGGFDQRKNMTTLLQAYAGLLTQQEQVPALVIAGQLPAEESELFPNPRRLARQFGLGSRVLFSGWIPESDKPALYSGAVFFAFLSLYEGFGLMPLEAMACGTPVLASRCSSLLEIVGEGGILVDPTDIDEVVRGFRSLLDDATRQTFRQKALTQAARFSWQQTARLTLEAYSSVAAG